jgi:hypothetical protein
MSLSKQQKEGILTSDNELRKIVTDLKIDGIVKDILSETNYLNTPNIATCMQSGNFIVIITHTNANIFFVFTKSGSGIKNKIIKNKEWDSVDVWDLIMKMALSTNKKVYHVTDREAEGVLFIPERNDFTGNKNTSRQLSFFDLYALRKHKKKIEQNLKEKK